MTVGSFDGVHSAHRSIVGLLNHYADLCRGESVLVTFSPHPRMVLDSDDAYRSRFRLLSTDEEKTELLQKAGLANLLFVHFDREFSQMSYGDFIEKILVGTIGARKVVVGFNHNFGHDREGGYEQMSAYARKYGFDLDRFPEQMVQHQHVSSTRIRALLQENDLVRANALLGYVYGLQGRFLGGQVVPENAWKLLPGKGNYLVRVRNGSHFDYTVCEMSDTIRFPNLASIEEGTRVRMEFIKELQL